MSLAQKLILLSNGFKGKQRKLFLPADTVFQKDWRNSWKNSPSRAVKLYDRNPNSGLGTTLGADHTKQKCLPRHVFLKVSALEHCQKHGTKVKSPFP